MSIKPLLITIFFSQCFLIMSQDKSSFLPTKIVIDEYHGQKIEDPYRYVEDLGSPIVNEWITIQNNISNGYLSKIRKKQYLIDKQIEFDKKKAFVISKLKVTENGNYFYLKRLPDENVPKLYYRQTFSSQEELLYDPKQFNLNSTVEYVINYLQPNWDGSKIVISLTKKGKEVSEMIIIDVVSKKTHPEIIKNVWPSNTGGVEWLPDNSSFIYIHYTTTDPKSIQFSKNTKSVIYKLGNDPKILQEVFSKTYNPDLNLKEDDFPITSLQSKNSKYLIGMTPGAGSHYNSYYLPIEELDTKNWKPLFKNPTK